MNNNIHYPPTVIDAIRRHFIKNNLTLAVAESVTAGHLQAALSTAKDASQFFQGGITVYNIGQKCRHLHVEPVHAVACDCVSDIVSATMAENVCHTFLSDAGIAVTGYASPVPEKGIEELYAWYAITAFGDVLALKKIIPPMNEPFAIQVFYANEVLKALASAKVHKHKR